MSGRILGRRAWLRGAGLGLVALGVGCKREATMPASCTDTAGLAKDDVQARAAVAYADSSPQPGKACSGCQQFVAPPDEGTCGSCKLLKGPVHPNGYCRAFAPKA